METSALGSSLIAASGAGSTDFDVETMATGLANAEVATARYSLTGKQEQDEAKLSAWGSMKSALSGFHTYLDPMTSQSSLLQRTVTSSDESVFTATATDSAAEGTYSLEVDALAKANSIYSASYSALSESIGTGSLSFSFGTVTVDGSGDPTNFTQNADQASTTVTITDGSLEGIRDAVNDADFGVQASIVNDGSGYRLTFTSTETGAENAIQVSVDDDDSDDSDNAGLSELSFNTTSSNLEQSTAGQDASIKINGLSVVSGSNSVTDVIEGVTLNLLSSDAGVTKSLVIAYDSSSLKTEVSNFVADYNAMKDVLDSYGGENGDLQGDSMIRGLRNQLRSLTSMPIDQLSGSYTDLTSVGVEFDSDGGLSIDDDKFDTVLSSDFSAIADLFVAQGKPTDSQVKFESLSEDTVAGEYAVNITAMAEKASLTVGTTVDSLVVDENNDYLLVKVDGILSDGITLTQKTYSSETELAAELQSKINGDSELQESSVGVTVTHDAVTDKFVITSNRYGSASTVEIVGVDLNGGDIGLQVESAVSGVDVAGTINGGTETATGSGQYLTSTSGDSVDLKLRISGGSTGDRGTVAVSRGVADQLMSFINNYIETDGLIEDREESLDDKLEDYQIQSEKLDEKYESLLARYRSQFSILNGLLGSLEQQRDWMTATFENM